MDINCECGLIEGALLREPNPIDLPLEHLAMTCRVAPLRRVSSFESACRDQSLKFAASERVMNSDKRKMTGAAMITTGSIKTQATAQDRSQCPRNPPAQVV
jgi:hypothetical protein